MGSARNVLAYVKVFIIVAAILEHLRIICWRILIKATMFNNAV